MAKLVSMKLPKRSKKEMAELTSPMESDQPKYPYGLQLRFDNDSLKKLPVLRGLKVGTKVMIEAEAEVSEYSERESQSGENYSCELQVTDISIEPPKGAKDKDSATLKRLGMPGAESGDDYDDD
jgi:hypothetical protein